MKWDTAVEAAFSSDSLEYRLLLNMALLFPHILLFSSFVNQFVTIEIGMAFSEIMQRECESQE